MYRTYEFSATLSFNKIYLIQVMFCKRLTNLVFYNISYNKNNFDIWKVNKMERHIKQIQKALEEKYQENIDLEKTVFEHQTMLQQSTTRIAELEDIQSELGKQVKEFKASNHTSLIMSLVNQVDSKSEKRRCSYKRALPISVKYIQIVLITMIMTFTLPCKR